MEEIWKKIPEIPEAYEVSNFGRVRTWYPPYRSWGKLRDSPVQKAVTIGKKGYRQVTLTLSIGRRHVRVSHLVLRAFDGPRPDGYEASHLDGNKLRDVPDNLLWETGEDNRSREELWPRTFPCGPPKTEQQIADANKKYRAERKILKATRKSLGLCVTCGRKRNKYKSLCDECRVKRNAEFRKRRGGMGLRRVQRDRLAAGLCIRCSAPLGLYSRLCNSCYAKMYEQARGFKWKPGMRGRTPKAYQALIAEMYEKDLDSNAHRDVH
jgi:hypothetical protein